MKKKLLFLLPGIILLMAVFSVLNIEEAPSSKITELRQKHIEFLKKNKPKKANTKLSRKDKIQQALPPNQYYEQFAYLTMNPALGYPEPYKIKEIQKKLDAKRAKKNTYKIPGLENEDPWIERGPTNVGGRTRVLLFDPNDASHTRVFAGAISGGLWVNEDITNEDSPWNQVSGLPANMNVSCITIDPRDSNTWYLGTGEQYTAGDVVGTGVYKTTDGGITWNKILDVEDFATDGTGENALVVGGIHYINDIIAWDNGTSTEIFIGVSTHVYANAANPTNFLGFFDRGLYKSTNNGANWESVVQEESFNDFATDANGNLWVATTNSPGMANSNGGKIFRRNLGNNTSFELIYTIPEVLRTEIEASTTNPDKFYILAEGKNEGNTLMWITENAFESMEPLAIPNDADENIPPEDFARDQAFYNLVIEADPTNDEILYAGGINLFRSTTGGESWKQISKWSNNNNLQELPVSLVHADHHVMVFRPGNTNQAIFGHDGGVSFANNLATASKNDVFISPETNYITSQFYSIAVAPSSFSAGDYFLGGTQDNGTQLIQNGNPASFGVLGGDGAFVFYDQVDTDYFVANLVYNNFIVVYDYSEENYRFIADNEDNEGLFINPQALDSNLGKLYSNGPEGILYRYDDIDELSDEEDVFAVRESLANNLFSGFISALKVSPYTTTSTTLVVGLANGQLLWVEQANGEPSETKWKAITGSQFLGSISDVEFGNSENELLVTFYNYGVENVWYTENALDDNPTWINKEGNLPDMPILAILKNPLNPEEAIVGTQLGVWATQNFSSDNPNWEQAYNGMSDVKVTDLDLKKGDQAVFAASYGRGMFSSQFTGEGEDEKEETNAIVDLVVVPTVSHGDFSIISQTNLGSTRVEVFDLRGQLVFSTNVELTEKVPVPLQMFQLSSGIYLVKLTAAGKEKVQKIVVK